MSHYKNDKKPESSAESSDECADHEANIPENSTEVLSIQPSSVQENENTDNFIKIDHLPSVQSNLSLDNDLSINEADLAALNIADRTAISYNTTEDEPSITLDESKKEYKNTYELENYAKNIMIIFNHEFFIDSDSRKGTNLDAVALKNTFEQFRFEVTTHEDLEEKEIFAKLEDFSKQKFYNYGCICVAILTHGSDHGQLWACDSLYSEKRVFKCFDEEANESLRGKPIIFLIQACRGPQLARCVRVPQGERPAAPISLDRADRNEGRYFLPTEANILIFHSCFFGRASARVEKEGTWFIQTICKQILEHADKEHLEKIFRRVKHVIALEKVFQMPVTSSTLLRKLFLKRKQEDQSATSQDQSATSQDQSATSQDQSATSQDQSATS